MTAKTELGSLVEFIKAVRDASEGRGTDYELRISEDWIKMTLRWISVYRPDLLEEAVRIVYHADEGIKGVDSD